MMRAADLFCGAGGSTTGAAQAGVDVVLAVNHWRTAIFSHEANHPDTRHICARIDDIDPRFDLTIPNFDLLMASPECTHHSNARGGRPMNDQKRATPWHVCVWAEAKRPKWIVVENVREFRDWGPLTVAGRPNKRRNGETFRAWVKALESLGYQVDHQVLNAADFGAATKRLRLFVVARRGRSKKDIPWPGREFVEPPAEWAKRQNGMQYWRPAWSIIDWSRPCPSIFDRKRPLADKTLRRIEIGLKKFVGEAAEPFIVTLRRNMDGRSTGEPLATITAGAEHHALATPFVFKYHSGQDPAKQGRPADVKQPLPTLDANPRYAVCAPFMADVHDQRRDDRASGADEPLPTVVTAGHVPASPYLIDVNHGGNDGRSNGVDKPLGAVTTKRGKSLVLPFLTEYFGTGGARSVDDPLSTVTTKHRHGLAMVSLIQTMHSLGVYDIGFRMLDDDELAAAQGFPAGYQLHGNKADRIKQIGNAVPPPFTRAICQAIQGAA